MFLKANSGKDVLIHLVIILAIFAAVVLLFFYAYLPLTTHHGESIPVPKLVGMNINEIEKVLAEKNLRYEINDSTYTPGVKPYTVLSQHPVEGSQVKQNRKIYVSIAAATPPKVKMPKLTEGSLKSAELVLKSYDLVKGSVITKPSPYANLVLDQLVKGRHIEPGTPIAKGTKIDLVVGDGSAKEEVSVPDLKGMKEEEAQVELEAFGLLLGVKKTDNGSRNPSGTITKQKPSAGTKIKPGEEVDIWVAP